VIVALNRVYTVRVLYLCYIPEDEAAPKQHAANPCRPKKAWRPQDEDSVGVSGHHVGLLPLAPAKTQSFLVKGSYLCISCAESL